MVTFFSKSNFRKVNLLTIITLFVLILAGGVVRSSGSGMGCPDWPKCFGGYVPPTDLAQLPKDYQQEYVNERVAKNQKFAQALDMFGFTELAERIRKDKSILIPEDFNVTKAWTEYINRLLGMLTGIFLFLTLVFSFGYTRYSLMIPILSFVNLLLVYFQAWLGSIVVSSNLVAWIVTVHMMVALAILAICIGTYYLSKVYDKNRLVINPLVYIVTLLVLALTIIQIVFGTEVREKIDSVSTHLQGGYREDWVSGVGSIFIEHRSMAIFVLIGNVVLYALVRRGFGRYSIQQ